MALRQVLVTNTQDGVIDQYSIEAGIQAIIYVPADTNYGDLVEFHWGSLRLQRAYLPADFPNYTWIINVKAAFPQAEALSNGTYDVDYKITDYLGNESTAPTLTITVVNSEISDPNFAAPAVQATINQAQWIAGFDVTIPGSDKIQDGDTWTLYARANEIVKEFNSGTVAGPTEPTGPDEVVSFAAEAIVVPSGASNPALAGLDGVNTFFYYTITRGPTVVGTSASKTAYVDVVPPGGNA